MAEKQMIPALPAYINEIIEYAVRNAGREEDLKGKSITRIELAVQLAEDSPLFEETVYTSENESFLIDCWEIFELSKKIMSDSSRKWNELEAAIDYTENKKGIPAISLTVK